MKIPRCLTCVASLGFLLIGMQAANAAVPKQPEKQYISSGQVQQISKEGIVVRTKSGDVLVKALRSDNHGIYIYRKDVRKGSHKGYRRCSRCGRNFSNDQDYRSHLPCRG